MTNSIVTRSVSEGDHSKASLPMHPDDITLETLREIANRHGTPTYAFDVRRMRSQVNRLRHDLPDEVGVFYSLKANASLGVAEVFSAAGINLIKVMYRY